MSAINEIQQKLITQLDMKLEELKPEQVARLVAAGVLTEREAALVQIRLETAKPMQAPELREVTDHGYAPTLLQGFSGTAPTLQTGKDTNAGVMKLAQVDWQQVFANCNLTYGRITSSSAFGCSSKPLFKEPTGADIKQAFRPAQVSEQELAVVLFSDKFKAHSELCSAQAYQEVCTPLAAAAAEYKSASHQEQREVGTQYSIVHKYQVPAGSFKIDTEHLELNPGFVKSVEDALSAAGNCLPEELSKFFEDRIFSTYGDVYPNEVMIGVAAFSTEVKNVTKQESKKQAADSAHVAASGIGQGVAGKGDVSGGHRNGQRGRRPCREREPKLDQHRGGHQRRQEPQVHHLVQGGLKRMALHPVRESGQCLRLPPQEPPGARPGVGAEAGVSEEAKPGAAAQRRPGAAQAGGGGSDQGP
ncbi:unnamed protein product [Effrenium voratum]|nr:unnamed protein product [Effrenium voratum]